MVIEGLEFGWFSRDRLDFGQTGILENFYDSAAAVTDQCYLTAVESHCQNTLSQRERFLHPARLCGCRNLFVFPHLACWLNEKK